MSSIDKYGLWIYAIHRKDKRLLDKKYFIYGYTIPLDNYWPSLMNQEMKIPFLNGDPHELEIIEIQRMLSKDEYDKLLINLRTNHVFNREFNETTDLEIREEFVHRPFVLQFAQKYFHDINFHSAPESIAPFLSTVESFILLNKRKLLEEAIGKAELELESKDYINRLLWMLHQLKNRTGLDFENQSVVRIGNFESFNFPLGSISEKPPIDIIPNMDVDENSWASRSVTIKRKGRLSEAKHWVHIILRNGGEVVLDKIASLSPGEVEIIPFKAQEIISECEAWLFSDDSNEIIYYIKYVIMNSFQQISTPIVSRKRIIDKFSQKIRSDKKYEKYAEELEITETFGSKISTNIIGNKLSPWVSSANEILKHIKPLILEPKTGQLFYGRLEGEAKAILHLRKVIDNKDNSEVILTDPYFDEVAFTKLLIRLENQARKITIITCGGSKSDQRIKKISRLCNEYQSLLPRTFKLISLTHGNEHAFHDRYLLCIRENDAPYVYILSNSINNAANDAPLCVVKLDNVLAREVCEYLRGLEKGIDITAPDRNNLNILKIWPIIDNRQERNCYNQEGSFGRSYKFPFWETAIDWLLDLSPFNEHDREDLARKAGILLECECWYFDYENVKKKLDKLIETNSLPSNKEEIARLLASIEEILARTSEEWEVKENLTILLDMAMNVTTGLDLIKEIASQYSKDEITMTKWGGSLSDKDHLVKYYYEQTEISLSLIKEIDHYFQNFFDLFPKPYGLYRIVISFTVKFPEQIVKWIGSLVEPKLRTFAFATIIDSVSKNDIRELIPHLLKSEKIFLKMLGAAGLHIRNERSKNYNYSFKEAVQLLQQSGYDGQDIVWIMAYRIGQYRDCLYRSKRSGLESEEYKQAEADLAKFYKDIAEIWPDTPLSEKAYSNLEESIRRNSRDRFIIADYLNKKTGGSHCHSAERLFGKCVEDLETTIGRDLKDLHEEFNLTGHDEYSIIEYGALAFYRLNIGRVPQRFRNRYEKHLDLLTAIISRPFAKRKDSILWKNCIGRCAASLLFGFEIAYSAFNSNEHEKLDAMVQWLIEKTHILFICEQKEWSDVGGLLGQLARTAAVAAISLVDSDTTQEIAISVSSNEKLDSYFRACFSIVHPISFAAHPKQAMELIQFQREIKGEFQVHRYFNLLDYFIGRAALTNAISNDEIMKEISAGLNEFNDISEKWIQYFNIVWLALQGNEDAVSEVLHFAEAANTFCVNIIKGKGSELK